jgi:hypothetical protein
VWLKYRAEAKVALDEGVKRMQARRPPGPDRSRLRCTQAGSAVGARRQAGRARSRIWVGYKV